MTISISVSIHRDSDNSYVGDSVITFETSQDDDMVYVVIDGSRRISIAKEEFDTVNAAFHSLKK